MSAMIYNPNNVATEASLYTTKLEREGGLEFCLDQEGHGRLLGEAIFSRAKESKGVDVEGEKDYIRDKIPVRDNQELFEDKEVWEWLYKLGGDLMINALATNFKIGDEVNQDVTLNGRHQPNQREANCLSQWKLSVSSENDVVKERPLLLTSSEFGKKPCGNGVVVVLDDVLEASLQPLTYEEAKSGDAETIATGTINIGDTAASRLTWVMSIINMDPAAEDEDHQH
ncbi:uncharacterized protein C8A04DRAFT_30863 [Dichotomopilus funicola]|uniref:Uncharacterized protein n=1 Tax=Dichotomopilus funicola TaxID=1934379 RepID=A0AAN6ZJJ8_9PEZI|nr:hypothetical protein C8A04DRAFT_30863 [Dichotomopilus funicola]